MTFLEEYSDKEIELLISTPVRAGVWLSSADDTGNETARYVEIRQMKNTITRKAKVRADSEFVHEIMKMTVGCRTYWGQWYKSLDSVLDQCNDAVRLVLEKRGHQDANAYKDCIMEICNSVAGAYREFDDEAGAFARLWVGIKMRMNSIAAFITHEQYDTGILLDVSLKEDIALSKLEEACCLADLESKEDDAVLPG